MHPISRGIIVLALASAAPLSAAPLRAQQPIPQPAPPVPRITVSGMGDVRATPDRATIAIGVQTRAKTAAAASAENARRQQAVLDTLRALGIPKERILTSDYSVNVEQDYRPDRGDSTPRVTGYVVSNVVQVDVWQVGQVGRLIDAALAVGANAINSLQFYSSRADELRREALSRAVAAARADAEAMAKAAGGSLGPLLELSSIGYAMPLQEARYSLARAADAAAPTPIAAGEQTTTATVSASWQFVR